MIAALAIIAAIIVSLLGVLVSIGRDVRAANRAEASRRPMPPLSSHDAAATDAIVRRATTRDRDAAARGDNLSTAFGPVLRPEPGERCPRCHRRDSRERGIPCALCNLESLVRAQQGQAAADAASYRAEVDLMSKRLVKLQEELRAYRDAAEAFDAMLGAELRCGTTGTEIVNAIRELRSRLSAPRLRAALRLHVARTPSARYHVDPDELDCDAVLRRLADVDPGSLPS